ncbi:hypothetical protein ARAM_005232 [Aspergillus rambellii]|uniref:AT DNA binding protein n=1 Tax=Aspergillus rambellii TaxID=308745 RepID=A0A0F8UQN4_9EURO|nr:hypothetical protein ARAM_005232 [Aspergillus rambellii]
MSNLPERPWTEEEKYTLLTEILKKARVPSSHLVKMIKDFNISPSWADIPLPSGRSLNSCQLAFYNMCQQHVQLSVNPGLGSIPPPRYDSSAPPATHVDASAGVRKRPLYPADKPILAPRAIQPRPSTSTASYSSESGASAILSPGTGGVTARGEPPRKRGRPSKAESERRKAAAEARGETYPPVRRSGSHKVKISSTPTSPSTVEAGGSPFTVHPGSRPPNVSQPEMRYVPPPLRTMPPIGPVDEERARDMSSREIGPAIRELPRPTEIRQTLPSPQALQLGHRETIPRIEPGERPYGTLAHDRHPFTDSSRRSLVHPAPRRPDELPTIDPQVPLSTTAEKRTE